MSQAPMLLYVSCGCRLRVPRCGPRLRLRGHRNMWYLYGENDAFLDALSAGLQLTPNEFFAINVTVAEPHESATFCFRLEVEPESIPDQYGGNASSAEGGPVVYWTRNADEPPVEYSVRFCADGLIELFDAIPHVIYVSRNDTAPTWEGGG